jgi:tetratricopeptide (TPR) repeat protein
VADEVTARTTMLVIAGTVSSPDPTARSSKAEKVERLNRQVPGRVRVVTEADFCNLAGVASPDQLRRTYHSLKEIRAAYPNLRDDHLRYLEKWGLIRPVVRTKTDTYLTFSDRAVIKQASNELQRGASFRTVLRTLDKARHGQLELDFRIDAPPAKIVELRRPRALAGTSPSATRPYTLAEQYFLRASALDSADLDRQEEVIEGYRKALELDPNLVPALINLANVHYDRNEFAEAEALCERAILLDPAYFEAHFNLANLCHDRGEYEAARRHYLDALALNPDYPNAHFYLAVTLEKMGQSADAQPHWRAYQSLAPGGEWVDLAREFSD